MFNLSIGYVEEIIYSEDSLQEIMVNIQGKRCKAWAFNKFTGFFSLGDEVILNTTAIDLNLGTGGYHFVVGPFSIRQKSVLQESGHIMKLRYTPWQNSVLSVEEPDSPYHEIIKTCNSLEGQVVVIGFLHSMLPGIIAGLKVNGIKKIAYIMTDGAALAIGISKLVKNLKEIDWLQNTITIGQSFGGDFEAVNIYSGLLTAKAVCHAEVIIVIMGPGIVGTGTTYGNTALEVGQIINAVNSLEGRAVVVPRISFQDTRERHHGLSHHNFTALGKVALSPAEIILPLMEEEKQLYVMKQINEAIGMNKHRIIIQDGKAGFQLLHDSKLRVTTMGRGLEEESDFFLASTAAGEYAGDVVVKATSNLLNE